MGSSVYASFGNYVIPIKLPVNREPQKEFKISEKSVTTKSGKWSPLSMHGLK